MAQLFDSIRARNAAANAGGRWTEIFLLLFAVVIVGVAAAVTMMSMEKSITVDLIWLLAGYFGLFALAHAAVRMFAPYSDPYLLPCAALLNGIGLVIIYRLDLAAEAADPEASFDVIRQLMWTLLGIVALIGTMIGMRDHRALSKFGYTLGFFGLLLLMIPTILPSRFSEVNGAKNWILLPGFSIQPGEFSKILLIISMAAILVSKRDLFATAGKRFLGIDLPRARDLGPVLLAWLLSLVVLVLNSDLGTSLLIFATVLTMIYTATEKVSWLLIGLVLFIAGATAAYFMFGHVRVRVQTWLDPFAYYDGTGYQLSQGMFGMATGGVGGTGLGNGRPQQVPFANTDFITSTIGEELGLIGLAAVLLVYLVFVYRAIRIALTVRDSFGKLLATGLGFTIAVQLFVVVGGVSRLIPMTGLTMPFVAYGGSSLLANYIILAILLRISNEARTPLPPVNTPAPAAAAAVPAAPAPQAAPAAPAGPAASAGPAAPQAGSPGSGARWNG
ncbi:FtsW/RodA/SpoVE family cell cycle protein [Dietzia sp.]|uniref:FtsW/RodA/SpoVE family cell cycle protein n=1 Tax=Dietzia sp. TaxID=1871616 RepID=UPI002FDB1CD7